MSFPLPPVFECRVASALHALNRGPELRAAVCEDLNAFYQGHPHLERTDVSATLIAMILAARISA